ncbi:MAG TPA: serine/threonine-protein kinase [Mycobacteriales bacterium]|nr:serine/threonine-protein kinase [Mycobacteriales bacterium]
MTGRVINGRYELAELPVGTGGMGEVWLGRDTKLDREVAVKFIRYPGGVRDPELDRRFVRESRITARLEHPGVPAVYDVGTHEGRPYLVMQRIGGISVADLVAEHGPLPLGWAAAIAAQVCAVLSVAHAASLVHRDLKPSNLMLEPPGSVKVLDFGLAVALDLAEVSRITSTGQTLGTPAYMAPEQVLAAMSAPASDFYALGCTLHEMLTGSPLFTGPTAYAVMSKQVDEPPRPVGQLRADVPVDLERLIDALLAKKPEDRPADAGAIYRRLLPFVTDLGPLPAALDPPSTPSPVRMYAGVLGHVFTTATGRTDPAGTPNTPDLTGATAAPSRPDTRTPTGSDHPPRFSRGELARARGQAGSLVRDSRYGQAAEVLAAVVEPASQVLGARDVEVVSLRLELANVLFEGGDYRRAAPAYQALAAELSTQDGPDADLVFRCRLQEATCHALVGQTSLALRQLSGLRDDERRIFGPDDPRTLELRRQIGLLQLGAGQRSTAEATLQALLVDLTRLHGAAHPTAERVRQILAGLPPPRR